MTLGVLTFVAGVALLLVTFKLAYNLFTLPPDNVISYSVKDSAVDLGKSGNNLATIVVRVLLLIVMGLMGSLIANRGVSMFVGSRERAIKG